MDDIYQRQVGGADLYDRLCEYSASEAYPFHMPGHKRRLGGMCDPFEIDITEIEGFDDLHHAQGILREAQERASALYGSGESYFLINGSTAGVLAAICAAAAADPGKRKLLMARGSHKSAYHAVYLSGLEPVWLYARENGERCGINGRIDPRQVERRLEENPDICAVFLTSPTYDGMVSQVRQIAEIAHAQGALLIVDEAHGAHFGLHPDLPENSVQCGADLVIHSLHKTLPSLTQTGLLHVSGDLADRDLIRRFLDMFQTSSPSYVLMAGIDRCVGWMAREGRVRYDRLLEQIKGFRAHVKVLKRVRLVGTDDPTRILICAAGLSGKQICAILRQEFMLEPEMEAPAYVLCLLGAGDTREGLDRLEKALERVDQLAEAGSAGMDAAADANMGVKMKAEKISPGRTCAFAFPGGSPEMVIPLAKAWDLPFALCPLRQSTGKISAEFVYLYPPGIPLLAPGERITPEILGYLTECKAAGFTLHGMADHTMRQIRVCREDIPEVSHLRG